MLESDFSALNSAMVMFSPALTRDLESHYATGTETFLQTQGGTRTAKRVLGEVVAIDPIAGHFPSEITTSFVPIAQGAVTPEAVALGLFGGIAGVAALLLGALLIAREVRTRSDDLDALRAVGADRLMLVGDEVVGMWGAVLVGALVAVGVAISLSPLTPIGPVRSVYPERGVAIDGVVLGLGFLILVAVLGAITAFVTTREIHRHAATAILSTRRKVGRTRAASALSLPLSMDTGLRFATEAGRGRDAAPVRFAMLGSVLAVTVLVSSVTFGGSLNNLVSHPPLYGWNWNYALLAGFAGAEDLPGPQVATLLNRDRDVQAWSGVNLASARLDGQRVQVMTERPGAVVAPPVLAGHGLVASNQVDLGPATLATLHKRVGDMVMLNNGVSKPLQLVIVGTVTMPALGQGDGQGTGAVVATSDFPTALLNLQDATVPGPERRPCPTPAEPPAGRGPRVAPADQRRHQSAACLERPRRRRHRGAPAGWDRQLPLDGDDPGDPLGRTRARGDRRPRPDALRVRATQEEGARPAQVHGVLTPTALRQRCLDGHCRRDRWHRRWHPDRGRRRTAAVAALRTKHQRRS